MFAGVSHSYAVQVVALWLSFLPVLAMGMLIIGMHVERYVRGPKPAPGFSRNH